MAKPIEVDFWRLENISRDYFRWRDYDPAGEIARAYSGIRVALQRSHEPRMDEMDGQAKLYLSNKELSFPLVAAKSMIRAIYGPQLQLEFRDGKPRLSETGLIFGGLELAERYIQEMADGGLITFRPGLGVRLRNAEKQPLSDLVGSLPQRTNWPSVIRAFRRTRRFTG